ncbi:MAG: hypothetical protein QXO11_08650, partial [Thermoplasmata archaeon]
GLIKLSVRSWKIAYWQDGFTPEVSKSHCAYYTIFGKLVGIPLSQLKNGTNEKFFFFENYIFY